MNKIISFKNRKLDNNKPAYIYRNLNKKGIVYSIKQYGEVKGHATELNLENCEFIVNKKSRDKIRETGKKVVHAYVKGFLTNKNNEVSERVIYNPKIMDGFTKDSTKEVISKANLVKCSNKGVHIDG